MLQQPASTTGALHWQTAPTRYTKRKKAEEREALPDTVKALQAAQADTDALAVDQEYRVAMLELGLTDDTTTDTSTT